MALKGTLKDFGIADILQLIGQQQKTGTLHLKSKDQEVHVGFVDGNIVKAESSTRNKKDLIGNMLVRAEVITQQQLDWALETQKRTLQRLGDILVQANAITGERFRQMVQLQMSETLYRLFSWKAGSYEFEQGEVEYDQKAVTPLRAESVLMEGFRMVDEWPVIRRRISTYQMCFEAVKPLPQPAPGTEDFDSALDHAFAEKQKDVDQGEFKSIGESERRVYALISPSRDVRKLIDLSCLGEFETCKALCNLVNLEYIRPLPTLRRGEEIGGGASMLERVGKAVGRVLVSMLVLLALGLVATQVSLEKIRLSPASGSTFSDPAAQRFIARQQLVRIRAAIDVYRAEKGEVPEKLGALVEAGLLAREDLRYPWRDDYYYRRTASGEFILLPPLR